MREIVLTSRRELRLPVDGADISPRVLGMKTTSEIESIAVWEGNRKIKLADIFRVSETIHGDKDEVTVRVVGDVSKVRRIGSQMSSGFVIVEGNAGMYVGEEMSGGSIVVSGDTGRWLGTRMKSGHIEVKGNAGDYVGGGYRGANVGMKGGTIIIHGNAGQEVGCWMRNGTIIVKGDVGLFPGMHMGDGTIYVEGNCEGRAGAQMRAGKILVGGEIPSILPSFTFEEIRPSAKVGEEKILGPFYVFSGDMNENGKGRLSVNVTKNQHLKWCERFMEP